MNLNKNNTKLASLQSEIKQESIIQNNLNSQSASVYAHMREEKEKANKNNTKLASLQSEIKKKSNIQNNLNYQLASVYAHMREEKEKANTSEKKMAKLKSELVALYWFLNIISISRLIGP